VVEQPLAAGCCVVVHAPAVQVMSVSQETRGSSPYSQASTPVQLSPKLGFDEGHSGLSALPVSMTA
jgi:hypothetical protein